MYNGFKFGANFLIFLKKYKDNEVQYNRRVSPIGFPLYLMSYVTNKSSPNRVLYHVAIHALGSCRRIETQILDSSTVIGE